MADTVTRLMTFEEFDGLPNSDGGFRYELRHGEVVYVPPPKHKHHREQRLLRRLLEAAAGERGIVETEFAFRALPEYEYRVADVAYVTQERWESIDPEGNLRGAPEMVIEVLSPSNTAAEIADKKKLCLENGCREFWVVNLELRQVEVSTPDGITTTYCAGQEISLALFGGGSLKVASIFS